MLKFKNYLICLFILNIVNVQLVIYQIYKYQYHLKTYMILADIPRIILMLS